MAKLCVCCHEWSFPKDEFEDEETCPNCDFPRKYEGWIEQLQGEIAYLKHDVNRLERQLSMALGGKNR
jgi:hypothetical protein